MAANSRFAASFTFNSTRNRGFKTRNTRYLGVLNVWNLRSETNFETVSHSLEGKSHSRSVRQRSQEAALALFEVGLLLPGVQKPPGFLGYERTCSQYFRKPSGFFLNGLRRTAIHASPQRTTPRNRSMHTLVPAPTCETSEFRNIRKISQN